MYKCDCNLTVLSMMSCHLLLTIFNVVPESVPLVYDSFLPEYPKEILTIIRSRKQILPNHHVLLLLLLPNPFVTRLTVLDYTPRVGPFWRDINLWNEYRQGVPKECGCNDAQQTHGSNDGKHAGLYETKLVNLSVKDSDISLSAIQRFY